MVEIVRGFCPNQNPRVGAFPDLARLAERQLGLEGVGSAGDGPRTTISIAEAFKSDPVEGYYASLLNAATSDGWGRFLSKAEYDELARYASWHAGHGMPYFGIPDFAPGGWILNLPGENRQLTYLRTWKADSENLLCYGANFSSRLGDAAGYRELIFGEPFGWVNEYLHKQLREGGDAFMLVREPLSHFLSGYNEAQLRVRYGEGSDGPLFWSMDLSDYLGDHPRCPSESVAEDCDPDLDACWERMQDFLRLPADSVDAFHDFVRQLLAWRGMDELGQRCWGLGAGGMYHVFLQSGQLAKLAQWGAPASRVFHFDRSHARFTAELVNHHFNYTAGLPAIDPLDCYSHPSSQDPLGAHAAAKRVAADTRDKHVDAVCFIILNDYACFPEYLPTSRCLPVYAEHFEDLRAILDQARRTEAARAGPPKKTWSWLFTRWFR